MPKNKKKKIYIVTDLEGISGVLTFTDTGRDTNRSGPRYEAARLLLTEDVNAAVQGALDGGAGEIIVNDGHGGGSNFVMANLHPGARYFSGSGRIKALDGLDESTDAVMLVGFHAMSGTRGAVMDHTQSSAVWHRYFLNGIEMGEIGQMSVIAGHFNAPVICVTGDLAATLEAKALLGDIETAAVKEGRSRTSAICLAPKKARELIRAAAKCSLGKIGKIKPYKIKTPVEIKLECATTDAADSREKGGAERLDGFTVRRVVSSALDIMKI
ncbi:MAG: M55 family metallopeptidase [Kiritimatiellae bacterium]|nr:M55 family metallopeptidase [Kiritimatiellia bacterium]